MALRMGVSARLYGFGMPDALTVSPLTLPTTICSNYDLGFTVSPKTETLPRPATFSPLTSSGLGR